MNNRLFNGVALLLFAIALGWLLHIGGSVIVPIVFALIGTYVVTGLMTLLMRIPVLGPRMPAWLCYVLAFVFIVSVIAFAVDMLVANRTVIMDMAPRYQDATLSMIRNFSILLQIENEPTWESLRRDMFLRFDIPALVTSWLASLSSFLVKLVVVFLYAVFLLIERSVFEVKLARMFPDSDRAMRIRVVIREINGRIGAYLAMKTLLSLCLGLASWVVMRWMGLEFADLWALLIGLFNFIPYLGTALGVLFPVLMAAIQFPEFGDVLLLLIALGALQFAVGNVLDPYVMGSSLNLSPFAILVSIATWASLWGMAGAFLAVPLTVSLCIVFSEFGVTRPIAILLSKEGQMRTLVERPPE